jgi:nucleotide-binding universal stress UspA family protein
MYKNILLTIDLNNDHSWTKALPTAIALARTFEAQLHVMTVVPDFGMSIVGQYFPPDFEQKAIDDANKRLHAFIREHLPEGVSGKHIVAHGTIYQEILAMADKVDADLIVMESHRPELKDYLLGPNASKVVRHARQSVLVCRHED